MGWTSTADALDQVARSALQFGTKEDAIAFCEKHGWEYAVREPQMRRTSRSRRYAGYGDNFRYVYKHDEYAKHKASFSVPFLASMDVKLRIHWSSKQPIDAKGLCLHTQCCNFVWSCSVKRNGFPTGGLRSELDVNDK